MLTSRKTARTSRQSLAALAAKYSLDSFTIATSDGLVFASSIGNTGTGGCCELLVENMTSGAGRCGAVQPEP